VLAIAGGGAVIPGFLDPSGVSLNALRQMPVMVARPIGDIGIYDIAGNLAGHV